MDAREAIKVMQTADPSGLASRSEHSIALAYGGVRSVV
jgi:hypothetical protein